MTFLPVQYRLDLHMGEKLCVACWQRRECELVSKEWVNPFVGWLLETIKLDVRTLHED